MKTEHYDEENHVLEICEYRLVFEYLDDPGRQLAFGCTPEGECHDIDEFPERRANYDRALSDPRIRRKGIEKWKSTVFLCSCGAKEIPFEFHDARGIYAGKCCPKCEAEKKGAFRSDVMENPCYQVDEPIEPEDDTWTDHDERALRSNGFACDY